MPTDKGWLLIIFSFGNERLVIFVQVPTKELWELLFKIKVWNQHGRSLFWYQTGFSIIVVFSTASSKFLGGMAIPKSWVWPMVWLHASGFDLTMIRKFWCGNSSPQFFVFIQKAQAIQWWRVQCRCSLYPWFWWRWPPKPNLAHCDNKDMQTGAMCWFSNHMLHVFAMVAVYRLVDGRGALPKHRWYSYVLYSGVLPCCDFTKYFPPMQTRLWKLKKTAQTRNVENRFVATSIGGWFNFSVPHRETMSTRVSPGQKPSCNWGFLVIFAETKKAEI